MVGQYGRTLEQRVGAKTSRESSRPSLVGLHLVGFAAFTRRHGRTLRTPSARDEGPTRGTETETSTKYYYHIQQVCVRSLQCLQIFPPSIPDAQPPSPAGNAPHKGPYDQSTHLPWSLRPIPNTRSRPHPCLSEAAIASAAHAFAFSPVLSIRSERACGHPGTRIHPEQIIEFESTSHPA